MAMRAKGLAGERCTANRSLITCRHAVMPGRHPVIVPGDTAPDWFLLDLLALRAHFINRFGQPRWTIVHGQSMGGHISIATLELYPDVYPGRPDRVRRH